MVSWLVPSGRLTTPTTSWFTPSNTGGSAFYVRYSGRVFAVTAGHCVPMGKDPTTIGLARPVGGTLRWIDVSHVFHPRPKNPDPDAPYVEWADVAILVPKEAPDPAETPVLDFDRGEKLVNMQRVASGGVYAFAGYPMAGAMDYDAKHYRPVAYHGIGIYRGPASMEGCHALRAQEPEEGGNGTSGSPVACVAYEEGTWVPALAGMVLMWSNGGIHFLDVIHLLRYLRAASDALDGDETAGAEHR